MNAVPARADVLAGRARIQPEWLELREPADAAARSTELADAVHLRGNPNGSIHDLGCGTGSMLRWLAPRLPGRQHWIMHDRDLVLLAGAAATRVGEHVSVEVRRDDVTGLTAADLAGAALVTTSALLDLLTADEVDRIAAACVGAGCPALLTLSVDGQVAFAPADPLDAEIAAAFNAHQRREAGGRSLLGPDAATTTADAFARRGATVTLRPSPWRLGPGQAGLISEWLLGWLAAACEQRPELAGPTTEYGRRRQAELAQGRLEVAVGHTDLLAVPR